MTDQVIDKAYSWDDEIDAGDEFELLPAGDYDFTVLDFERQHFEGSEKMSACPAANIKLEVKKPDGKAAIVFHKVFLHSKTRGLLTAFFGGIGQYDGEGEKFLPNWAAVPGSTGRAKIGTRKYNDREYNEVKKFYKKNAGVPTAAGGVQWKE